jgi:DNA-binding NarL/FixJ family response regulator
MSQPIRILIVEDQFFFRLALHSIIDARPDMMIVGESDKGSGVLDLYARCNPDLTIMDLRLSDTSGFEIIAAIRAHDLKARIMVLSNYEGSEDIHRALQSGVMSYLTKDASGEELVRAILAVAHGKRYLPESVAAALAAHFPDAKLTDRESDVLRLLANGCSNREIATRLRISENTTRIHVSRILDKLGVTDRTQAVLVAIQRGLVHLESTTT